jgi:hypothetical protein
VSRFPKICHSFAISDMDSLYKRGFASLTRRTWKYDGAFVALEVDGADAEEVVVF